MRKFESFRRIRSLRGNVNAFGIYSAIARTTLEVGRPQFEAACHLDAARLSPCDYEIWKYMRLRRQCGMPGGEGMEGFSSKTPRRREAHRGDREHE
jgi:hypothetical protein